MHVNVLALADIGDGPADVLAVFPDGVAVLDVGDRHLVADRNVVPGDEAEVGVVVGHDAEHVGPGREALDDDDADRVLHVVNEQMRSPQGLLPRILNSALFYRTQYRSPPALRHAVRTPALTVYRDPTSRASKVRS